MFKGVTSLRNNVFSEVANFQWFQLPVAKNLLYRIFKVTDTLVNDQQAHQQTIQELFLIIVVLLNGKQK